MSQPPVGSFGPPEPAPSGDPVYVPQLYPEPYPQQYPQQPFPPQFWAPAPQGFHGPTYPPRRKSTPGAGWALFGAGVAMAIAALMPWAVAFGVSVEGTKGDGTLTAGCAIVIAVAGLVIGLRHGLLWASVTACVVASIVVLLALADIGDVTRFAGSSDVFGPGSVRVGPGLWLTLVAALFGVGASIVGMVRRPIV
jgi:hypothetical protein